MDLWLWFKAYLGRRMQCVDLGNSRSDLVHVISGVPLLFLVYINDLPDCISKRYWM